MKKNIIYTLILFAFAFSSCRKDTIDAGGTAVQDVAGEWWTQVDDGSGFGSDYFRLSTYNTAANTADKMFIDDGNGFYGMKGVVNVDAKARTFSVTDADELYYGVKMTVTDGKIVKDGIKAPGSGVTTDLITLTVTFSDSPGVAYKLMGYRRTKFLEDDH